MAGAMHVWPRKSCVLPKDFATLLIVAFDRGFPDER